MNKPEIIQDLSFEQILNSLKSKLKEKDPLSYGLLIDSDPAIELLEILAYIRGLWINLFNNGILAVNVNFASGIDLENLGIFYGITRKLISPADNESIPVKEAVYEEDEELRKRILEAPKGFSVAGPRSSYIYYGKLANDKVKDVSAVSNNPCEVIITVLSYDGNGIPSCEVIADVSNYLTKEEIRPLCDKVIVNKAEIEEFTVEVKLLIENNPNSQIIIDTVTSNIAKYVESEHKLNGIIAVSGIYAASHIEGVEEVDLISPSSNIVTSGSKAPYCTSIKVTKKDD